MKRSCPSRSSGYSGAIGSFTLSRRSTLSQTSGADGANWAPTASYAASGNADPAPAPGTGDADDDGVVFEASISEELAKTTGFLGEASDLLDQLPADSWLAFAQTDFGSLLDYYVDAFAGLVGGRDQVERQFKAATGLDLQEDVIAWMGDFGVFVRGSTVAELDGALVVETTDEAASGRFLSALERLARSHAESGIDIRPLSAPGGGEGFVEAGLSVAARHEGALRDARQLVGDSWRDQGYGAATEARAGEPCPGGPGLPRELYERVELPRGDLVVVAQRAMRFVHEAPESPVVLRPQRPDRRHHPFVLGDDVARPLQLLPGEAIQVPLRGVPQLPYAQLLRGPFARLAALVVGRAGEAALDASVADQEREPRPFHGEGDVLGLQGTAVHEEGGACLAQ